MSGQSLRRLLTMGVCCASLAIPSTARAQYPLDDLHQFLGASGQTGPEAPLIAGRDGALYGTTRSGGAFNRGTIFRMTLAGAMTTLYSFTGGAAGEHPTAALLEAADGSFYGMAETTVSSGQEAIAIFRMSPAGQFAIVHRFPFFSPPAQLIPATPVAPLIQAADGNLYGATRATAGSFAAGDFSAGQLFRMTPSGEVTVLHDFAVRGGVEQGLFPTGLIQAADGSFYGTTTYGGTGGTCLDYQCGYGTVFRMSPTGAVTVLHAFTEGTGLPFAPLIQASDGNFYGTTGQGLGGTLFRIAPSGAFSTLYAFPFDAFEDRPAHPPSLTRAADGNLYGTYAPERGGTLFRLSLQGVVTVLHGFGLSSNGRLSPDGNQPIGLVQASDGRFYGTTDAGGLGAGTAFVMDSAGTTITLHRFTFGADGAYPTGLIQASDGNFYGVTGSGGIYRGGTIFRVTPSGSYAVIYTFTGRGDGSSPVNVVQGRDGRLYGIAGETNVALGATDAAPGVFFRVSLDGTFTLLHTFDSAQEGRPNDLVAGPDGNFYGTSERATFHGTVFRATSSGTVTVVHAFSGAGIDGGLPPSRLIPASDGNVYGTAYRSTGLYAFRVTPSGTFTALRDLGGLEFGAMLMAEGSDGNLYGASPCRPGGRFFRMPLSGTSITLLADNGAVCPRQSSFESPSLTRGIDGFLYGTSAGDGGRVFRMNTAGALAVLHDFEAALDFPAPTGLIQASDGRLYGTTRYGGPRGVHDVFGAGTVFRVRVHAPLSPTTVTAVSAGLNGITLRWAGSAGAVGYVVRRIVPGQIPVVVARVTETSVTVPTGAVAAAAFYFVSAVNADGESLASAPLDLSWGTAVSRTPTILTARDYDGDGKADPTIFRSTTAEWLTLRSVDESRGSVAWGASALFDRPVPADYDGDGRSDIAVYRESSGEWFIHRSSDGALSEAAWGSPAGGDLPVPADYDGDGRADLVIFRGTTGEWFIHRSSDDTLVYLAWGAPELGDMPVPADYDGDGRADVAVYRGTTGEWFVLSSSSGAVTRVAWGSQALGDLPVPADYDGDGRTDVAVYRGTTGEWFIAFAAGGSASYTWGAPALIDVPVAADYDGDGRADVAVYRVTTGEWFIVRSGQLQKVNWGIPYLGDAVRKY